MRSAHVAVITAYLMSAASCLAHDGVTRDREQVDMAVGYGEPPFNESLGLTVRLPMAEKAFFSLLEAQKIGFRVVAPETGGIPAPRHRRDMDPSQFARMYEVYGGVDPARHAGKHFRAYVNFRGDVVYIENAFSYPSL